MWIKKEGGHEERVRGPLYRNDLPDVIREIEFRGLGAYIDSMAFEKALLSDFACQPFPLNSSSNPDLHPPRKKKSRIQYPVNCGQILLSQFKLELTSQKVTTRCPVLIGQPTDFHFGSNCLQF